MAARAHEAPARQSSFAFAGSAVDFNLSGLEPDFDPIYKVVVSGELRDTSKRGGLPEATLILSAYLKVLSTRHDTDFARSAQYEPCGGQP